MCSIAVKAEKVLMAHSLEGRFSFLDDDLADFVAPRLPRAVVERPKMGFTVPPQFFLHDVQCAATVRKDSMQHCRNPARLALPVSAPARGVTLADLALEVVQLPEELQRLLGDGTLVVGPQLMELAPRVRHAADLGHPQLVAGHRAREVVGDQLALPAPFARQPEELPHVLAAAAVGEVEDHRPGRAEAARTVCPQVRLVR